MKKRFFTVCIAILTVMVCIFAAGCTSAESFDVKETSLRSDGKSAAVLMKEICEEYPERTMGSGKDYKFLTFINEEMTSYGYPSVALADGGEGGEGGAVELATGSTAATAEVKQFSFKNAYTNATEKGYNLIYTVPAAEKTDDNVLLLAAYDNCAGLEISTTDLTTGQTSKDKIEGQGAYANASGVAVLLRIAYELAGEKLPYNLTIAFVDCSENAWEGAEEVAKTFAGTKGRFICLNFNKLGGGDHTYVYSDESEQAYNDYFYSVVEKTDKDGVFAEIPFNKQIAEVKFLDGQKTDYSHYAMYGDNLIFNIYGLAVASYISFNWSTMENPFYTEAHGYANVFGTSADTYDEMIARLGGEGKGEEELAKRLDAVVLNAVTAVSADNAETLLGAVAESDPSRTGGYADAASNASLIVKIVLIVACAGVAVALTVKGRNVLAQKQRDKLTKLKEEAQRGTFAQTTSADDIFSLGDDKKDKSDDDKGNGGSGNSDGGDVFEGF